MNKNRKCIQKDCKDKNNLPVKIGVSIISALVIGGIITTILYKKKKTN